MTGMIIFQLSYLRIGPMYKKPQNLHPLKSCTVGKYHAVVYSPFHYRNPIHTCTLSKLPIDMEYALKAEDIGNGAVSDNTPQNDDGSDCVHIDCDRKNDSEDNNDGDTKRGDGCDEYKYHECVDGD